jgi:hypothetical protein
MIPAFGSLPASFPNPVTLFYFIGISHRRLDRVRVKPGIKRILRIFDHGTVN